MVRPPELSQKRRGFRGQTAGIVTHIDYQGDRPLAQQVLDGIHRRLTAAGFKVMDLDVSSARFLKTIGNRLGIDVCRVDLQRVGHADDGEIELPVHLRPDQRPDIIGRQGIYLLPVHRGNQHADHDPRACGR